MGRQSFFSVEGQSNRTRAINNSTSPNMFLIHKKYISRTQSDQKIQYNYSATPFVYSIRW